MVNLEKYRNSNYAIHCPTKEIFDKIKTLFGDPLRLKTDWYQGICYHVGKSNGCHGTYKYDNSQYTYIEASEVLNQELTYEIW